MSLLPIYLHCFLLKVSSLETIVEKISETQKHTEDKLTFLKDQLKDLKTMQNKLYNIEQQQHTLAKQQEACRQTVDAHGLAIASLKTSRKTCQNTVEELKTKQSETVQELDNLRIEHETFRAQTQRQQEACQQTVDVHGQAITALNSSQETCQKTVIELKAKQFEAGLEIDNLKTIQETCHNTVEKLKTKQSEVDLEIGNLKTSQETCYNTVEELKTKQSEAGRELHILRSEHETFRAQTQRQQEACQQTVDAHGQAMATLNTNQEICQTTVEEIKNKQSEVGRELVNLKTCQETCHRTVEELRTKQTETGRELGEVRSEHNIFRTYTTQNIEKMKATQEDFQIQANKRLDDLNSMNAPRCGFPTEEGKADPFL